MAKYTTARGAVVEQFSRAVGARGNLLLLASGWLDVPWLKSKGAVLGEFFESSEQGASRNKSAAVAVVLLAVPWYVMLLRVEHPDI